MSRRGSGWFDWVTLFPCVQERAVVHILPVQATLPGVTTRRASSPGRQSLSFPPAVCQITCTASLESNEKLEATPSPSMGYSPAMRLISVSKTFKRETLRLLDQIVSASL